tara:strand:+ start:813 stop:1007 length:195 start_codon:yes stop_codon:yes gene_type:complete
MSKSPCRNICSIHKKTGFCLGCYRTLEEIAIWTKLDNKKKNNIIFQLNDRKNALLNLKKTLIYK